MSVWSFLAAILQLSIIFRYIEALCRSDSCIYSLVKLRYVETMTESAPQWCLQAYIMLHRWKFPWYAVASSVLSFLSLTWSITMLEKERALSKGKSLSFTEMVVFTFWQFFTLASRLPTLVISAYVFKYYVFFFVGGHLLVVWTLIGFLRDTCWIRCQSWIALYPSLFHSSLTIVPMEKPKNELILGYVLLLVENIILVSLSLTIEIPGNTHMNVLKPVAIWCLAGGSILSLIFCLFSHTCFKYNVVHPVAAVAPTQQLEP